MGGPKEPPTVFCLKMHPKNTSLYQASLLFAGALGVFALTVRHERLVKKRDLVCNYLLADADKISDSSSIALWWNCPNDNRRIYSMYKKKRGRGLVLTVNNNEFKREKGPAYRNVTIRYLQFSENILTSKELL